MPALPQTPSWLIKKNNPPPASASPPVASALNRSRNKKPRHATAVNPSHVTGLIQEYRPPYKTYTTKISLIISAASGTRIPWTLVLHLAPPKRNLATPAVRPQV